MEHKEIKADATGPNREPMPYPDVFHRWSTGLTTSLPTGTLPAQTRSERFAAMIAVVSSVLLPLLFAGSGALSVAVLAAGWRRHAGSYARLRAELAGLDQAPTEALRGPQSTVRRPASAGQAGARPIGVRPAVIRPAAACRPVPAGLRVAA